MNCNFKNTRRRIMLMLMAATIWAVTTPIIMSAQTSGTGNDGYTRVLWQGPDSSIAIWKLDASLNLVLSVSDGPFAGWIPIGLTVGDDNYTRVIWRNTSGQLAVWLIDPNLNYVSGNVAGPFDGWLPVSTSLNSAGNMYVVWRHTMGDMAVWVYSIDLSSVIGAKALTNSPYIPGQEGAAKPRESTKPDQSAAIGKVGPVTNGLPDEFTPHFKPLTHVPQATR
jgi:hypothetical protein